MRVPVRYPLVTTNGLATATGEDRRAAGETCAVLLADTGRRTFDESTVLSDVAKDRVVIASGKLADRPRRRESEPRRTKEDG
jgi:hypothetical protein